MTASADGQPKNFGRVWRRRRESLTVSFCACYKDAVSVRLMKSRPNINSVTRTRVFRVIAILFLVYSGLDLTVPGVCSEEFSVPGIVEALASVKGPDFLKSFACVRPQTDFPQDQSPRRSPPDDDCFCCCSHVLRGNALTIIATEQLESAGSVPISNSLLSPPLGSPFRPPRNS